MKFSPTIFAKLAPFTRSSGPAGFHRGMNPPITHTAGNSIPGLLVHGLLTIFGVFLLSASCRAETGFYESEPNDKPADFHSVAGAVTLYGAITGQDQDGYLWTVSDNDARKRWNLTLIGEPGALTIAEVVQLQYADNGTDITGTRTLFKMGTRDGVTPAVFTDLLFEPGDYVIGLAQAGAGRSDPERAALRPTVNSLSFGAVESLTGDDPDSETVDDTGEAVSPAPPPNVTPGAYRLVITEGTKITPQPNPEGRRDSENAHGLRLGSEFSTFDLGETAWYSAEFDEQSAAQRWDLVVQAPIGRDLQARLVDADGATLLSGRVNDRGLVRFPDLAPNAASRWFVELTAPRPGFIHVISTRAVGQRIAGEEAEPNASARFANRVDFAQPVTGRIGGDDTADNFVFAADQATADTRFALEVETELPASLQICLESARLGWAQCRNGDAPLALPDLSLASDDWLIRVERASVETAYQLSLLDQGAAPAGTEAEPNDRIEYARGIPENLRIKGRFSGTDTDFHQILVSGEPQRWRFQVMGEEIHELGYYDGSGEQKDMIRAAADQRRVRLDNLFLLPGRHYLRVSGRDGGSYTLLARALGPPSPDAELEPNDQHNKQMLAVGQTRVGLSGDLNDLDHYRFFVANWDHLRLTFTPPADGMVSPYVYWYDSIIGQGMPSEPGKPMVMEGLFPPGDYDVVLHPRTVSDAEYTLRLERLARFSCSADCEPNGHGLAWLAAPLPADLLLEGQAGEWRDADVYQFPILDKPAELHILSADNVRMRLGPSAHLSEWLTFDAEFRGYKTRIPAGGPYRLMIESSAAPYRLQLQFPNGEIRPVSAALPASLELELSEPRVSAYRPNGQRVEGLLRLTNTGTNPLDARLEAVTSDHRWRVELDESAVTAAPGAEASVPFAVRVPADAWALQPVRISARALDDAGRQAETWTDITVDRNAEAVRPEKHWSIPEALRGGLNAAWLPFGAEWTAATPAWAVAGDHLRDGLVFAGLWLQSGADGDGWSKGEHHELTLDLPGDEPVPVAGTAINHFGTPGPLFNVREATLLLSTDGLHFEEALRFESLPLLTEQQFALERPIPARFARLRIDSTFRERSTERATMAEWKVILEPGFDLSASAGFNIADPALGGHVVWVWPPDPHVPREVLTPEKATSVAGTNRGLTKDYVVSFHQNRAAQITRIDWTYLEDNWLQAGFFERVEVAVSLASPAGPWLPMGELAISDQDHAGSLELPEPAWARFVRFTAHANPEQPVVRAPDQILIRERPAGDAYRSVLGEWGTIDHQAWYELQQGLPERPSRAGSSHTSRSRAAPIESGTPVAGQVALGHTEHWYRMSMPDDRNTLTVTLHGDPTVRSVVELESAEGNAISLRRIDSRTVPGKHAFEAVIEPGSEVYLRVLEPPRNVAFSWDTSASVTPYIPRINNAIVAFSGQVVPGREAVNLFPFPTGPLLDGWLGEPYMLQTILNDHRRPPSSSAAEFTLRLAAQSLGPLPGTKAMVVITDGDVNHDGAMWGEMLKTQPRVFSLQVGGAERLHLQLMRDWASINGGHFSQLVYDGEMDVAFDRASTLMHRPAGYQLQVDTEFREAPGPGFLQIIAPTASGDTGPAVELILDASGSMLQRMDGKRRISIAKDVLIEVVTARIPAGTPVALRVFGHREVDSCRTDLEIPLGPLDPQAAADKIADINAMNLARTPIADSLRAVAQDLGDASAGTVILVTDGEETCEGDPGAVIEALQNRGLNVSLNIVGFAIDDPALATQFDAWAASGGGRYLAANDQAGLSEAIEEALRIPFTVYDQGGNEITTGQVGGEAVELEQGIYRVVVGTNPQQRFDEVEVLGEEPLILELD